MPSQGEAVVVVPDGYTRCSSGSGTRSHCKRVFPTTYHGSCVIKQCQYHRDIQKRADKKRKETRPAEVEVEVPEGYTRCSRMNGGGRCKRVFPTTYRDVKGEQVPYASCEQHRASANRFRTSDKGREVGAKCRKTEGYKRAHAEHMKTDKAKATQKRISGEVHHQIAIRVSAIVSGRRVISETLKGSEIFLTRKEAQDHFESTFEPWMNWKNKGRLKSDTKPNTVWQIGHRIPIAAYDSNIAEDITRCWNKKNLFAQCARENNQLRAKLPNEAVLLSLQSIWPTSWNNQLPSV